MKINNYSFVFIPLLLFAVGCGNPSVTGKVTFPDGTPLDSGQVFFETPAMRAWGAIQSDGTYVLSSGELKGVPSGTYNVYIGNFEDTITFPPGNPAGTPKVTPAVIPIARKYLSPDTSGLTCDVKGNTTFDIKVEPPEK